MSYVPSHRPTAGTPSSQGSDDNQRALDRVTYLGGVLLPFSIVSGVLSMNEGFEPGQPLFWVFWVATIPLALLTVMVIYADKLRQVEVWEVLGPGGSDSDDQGSTGSGGGDKAQETDKGKGRPTPVSGTSRYDRRQQHEAVTYSAGGDVVIDLGTPAAEMQQIPAGPRGTHGEGQRTDSDQDQEGLSSGEDTAEGVALPITADEARHRPAWKKKQLGWGGAAMCMLGIKKPLWVLDGTPVAMGEETAR
ncbi:putative cysteine protease domain-containing protein [Diaporthe ampelina]|uniref:Putative cysteine protease domain-containing protein n=1 Tax=Diaporthe ampelina TaxID=1214573 RepID=A0A0G2FTP2_9PEZI|nr:putative cysteine protease domain-containing protein [Diaporthe ampelina]